MYNYLISSRLNLTITHLLTESFQMFAPRLFQYYWDNMTRLFSHDSTLRKIFPKYVWPAATFNFGPFTITFPHTDPGNLAWGWCSIAALGRFDPTKGGHLILWDLGIIIEFPPGSTILIPSALIVHSNTPIQNGETRYSFTQYCAGGLFHFIANGFRTDKAFMEKASRAQLADREAARSRRWEDGLAMFPKISELTVSSQ